MNLKSMKTWGILGTLIVSCVLCYDVLAEDNSPHSTKRIYLSGKGPSDAVEWDFYCSAGRRSGKWTKIPVPSNWEQHGFGGYDYGYTEPNQKHAEVGTYRVKFFAPDRWKKKQVRLVFEGSMTETSVKLNGKRIGAVHQGGYHPFHINLKTLSRDRLKYNQQNELEITVAKKPSNESLDVAERKADFWVFGGIYRPVYLEVSSKTMIGRVAIDAQADGQFEMDVFPHSHGKRGNVVDAVVAQIETLDGQPVGDAMQSKLSGNGAARITLKTKINNPNAWSPEFPNLYQVRTKLTYQGKILHEKVERFGFRTFELRENDGLYLNGKKIRIRGINRNGFRPDTARALDAKDDWDDARAIKAMNANFVRSHMPPTKAFMNACDELGLMYLLEQVNWQAPPTDPPIAANIVYSLIKYYQNHPCLVIWGNGNEGGFVPEIDDLFALLDKQGRPVVRPWGLFDGIDTRHYPDFDTLEEKLEGNAVYLPTEAIHGLYDGGHGVGLEDYWNAVIKSENGAGLVLWCWADAAIKRTDLDGKLDTDGNHSADGIVGPYGQKEASYYTVREIWSPIQIPLETLPPDFSGTLSVENRYYDTDINKCDFTWRLIDYSDSFVGKKSLIKQGSYKSPSIAPGTKGTIKLPLPANFYSADALELIALDPHGVEVMQWVWKIKNNDIIPSDTSIQPKLVKSDIYTVITGDAVWKFSRENGQLISLSFNNIATGLKNGPVLYAATEENTVDTQNTWSVDAVNEGNAVIISAKSRNDSSYFTWTFKPGRAAEISYSYEQIDQPLTYCAVGFDLDDAEVKSKRWLGDGPYRIWNNRRKGPQYGLWSNAFNDGLSGYCWDIPEFKGVFANVDWMLFDLADRMQLLVDSEPGSDIGVLRPFNTDKAMKSVWSYPAGGGLFLFHKVPAVGTKFTLANGLGPQSIPEKIKAKLEGKLKLRVLSRAETEKLKRK